MPETPVLAQSPLSLNANGKQHMIPLSALYFDSTGALKADRWPPYAVVNGPDKLVDKFLKRLESEGALQPGKQPAAKPAFTATAVTAGNVLVQIDIANVAPDAVVAANSKADFVVTETDTYTGLTLATLTGTVGAVANGGSRPGLVFVSSAVGALPKNGVYPLAGDPGTVDIADGAAGTSFTVTSRAGGADAALTSVEIKNAASGTFTLIATWTKTANAQAMTGLAAAFAYVLTITPPAGGFLAPAAGKIVLTGGSDGLVVSPVKASATVVAQ